MLHLHLHYAISMRRYASGVHKLAVSMSAVSRSSSILTGALPDSAVPERAKPGPGDQSAPAAQNLGRTACCSAALHCQAECKGESFTAGSGIFSFASCVAAH